jgi:hypothetical protein
MASTNTPARGRTSPTPMMTSVSSSKVLNDDLGARMGSAKRHRAMRSYSPVGPVPEQQSMIHRHPCTFNLG